MKRTYQLKSKQRLGKAVVGDKSHARNQVQQTVAQLKEAVQSKYLDAAGEHARLLRLSVNEAEALAWQTEFPHLFFPVLAEEKAQAALVWHRRQRAVRQRGGEFALSE